MYERAFAGVVVDKSKSRARAIMETKRDQSAGKTALSTSFRQEYSSVNK